MDKSIGVKINWCKLCPVDGLQRTTHLIPARRTHYAMGKDSDIDQSIIGVCENCLDEQSDFMKSRAVRAFNTNHTQLYKKT